MNLLIDTLVLAVKRYHLKLINEELEAEVNFAQKIASINIKIILEKEKKKQLLDGINADNTKKKLIILEQSCG